uniref:Uncharacterized protein n=1 Tax=Tanacetum cinerariifolium TaxID=118510 RepID=A0A6L2KYL8_TANCI|nr:hypothetical protein [Tanacetum cinerariifolium]
MQERKESFTICGFPASDWVVKKVVFIHVRCYISLITHVMLKGKGCQELGYFVVVSNLWLVMIFWLPINQNSDHN